MLVKLAILLILTLIDCFSQDGRSVVACARSVVCLVKSVYFIFKLILGFPLRNVELSTLLLRLSFGEPSVVNCETGLHY